ncbi:unnamed protein product [Polarella glacialis]|uniref:ABC1 atypical kinase-like domain-containing protein n=1 Tax=Polarella glacialis TaxID=89957 RepID=A0A813EUG9_POLGL|nr:unnamed protein product [Polarella glacialis]
MHRMPFWTTPCGLDDPFTRSVKCSAPSQGQTVKDASKLGCLDGCLSGIKATPIVHRLLGCVGVVVKPPAPPPKKLQDLATACQEAKAGKTFSLVRRSATVAGRLLPVIVCGTADALRPGGPRHAARNARRLRLALESLGPAFVKLGQALASREDVLSEEIAAELRKLCDDVPPFPCQDAVQLIREQLGEELALAVQASGKAVAAASLGQVYRVWLPAGPINVGATRSGRHSSSGSEPMQEFAVKVQRPGLDIALAVDVVILQNVSSLIGRLIAKFCATRLDTVKVLNAWAQTLWHELDYVREADTMDSIREKLCGRVPGLVIPQVSRRFSSQRVLTTSWIEGVKITTDPRQVKNCHILTGVRAYAFMILELGVVHADPHAGNLLLTIPGNEVCLLDFGMVVEVPESHRQAWASCIVHLVQGDYEAVLDSLIQIGFFPGDCPRDEVLPVMSKIWAELVACGSDTQRRKDAVRVCYDEIRILVRTFKFDLPDYYVALVRALLTLEGIALSADCDFDIFQAAFPVALDSLMASRGKRHEVCLLVKPLISALLQRLPAAHRRVAITSAVAVAAILFSSLLRASEP